MLLGRQTGSLELLTHRLWLVTRKRTRAASSQRAPTQPRSERLHWVIVINQSTAPNENPRYMKDALSERMTGANLAPVMLIKRACWAGKKPQAVKPHTATAIETGTEAPETVRKRAHSDRLASVRPNAGSAMETTRWLPNLSLAAPPK